MTQRARAAIASRRAESSTPSAIAPGQAEVVERFVHAWESGDFDDFVTLLATIDPTNAEKPPNVRQSRFVLGLKKLKAKKMKTADSISTSDQSP